MSRFARTAFYTAAISLLPAATVTPLFAQATGSISGTVTDSTSSAVPGAKVTVTLPATGLVRSSTTNDIGAYTVPLLGTGLYNVEVELSKSRCAGYPSAGG